MSEANAVIPAKAGIQENGLPEGWEILPVKSLGKAITGNTPPTKEPANYGGDIPFIKPTELVDRPVSFGRETISDRGAEKARILPKGGVLVSCIGNLGKTAIAKRDVAFNQQINAIVFNESVIPEYAFYYFQTAKFRKSLESLASATTISIVNKSKFESINVPIAPPEQQKRIVAKIEELFSHIDAGIEALKKAKQLLKQYRQSVLKAAVTGELTKEWREANKDKLEPVSQLLERILKVRRQKWEEQQLEQFKVKGKMPKDEKWKEKYKEPETADVEPFVIPGEWLWVPLETFLQSIEAGKSFKCDERPPNDGETGIVKVSAVTWGEFDSNESKTILDKSKINPNYRIEEGDFLFSRANTIELVGACVIVKHIDKDLLLSDKILRFVMPDEWKEWVQLCLRTQHGRDEIESLATGNQESMRNIAQGNIRKIRVPLIPEEELTVMSNIIVQKTDAIARMEIEIETQLAKAEKNKQSILSFAYSGNITG